MEPRISTSACSVLLAVVALLALLTPTLVTDSQAASKRAVVIIEIEGPINPAKEEFLRNSLEQAVQKNAALLLIRLDTPGGLLNSTKNIVELLLNAPLPVVVYVGPSGAGAISAGVFIGLSAHLLYMAPGTSIGAAHPVTSSGSDIQGDMREKLENYAASMMRGIAEKRGRNADWAESAVRDSVTITAKEAYNKKVIDGIASDIDRLLIAVDGATITVKNDPVTLTNLQQSPREVVAMSTRGKIIDFLCDPNIAIFLGMLAMLGLYIELSSPGLIIPGVVGVISFILSLVAANTLPINMGGAALIGLAALLLIVELFVPSFGVWGIAGIICLVLGSIYFVDTDMVWSASGFAVNLLWVFGALAVMIAVFLVACTFIFDKAKRVRKRQKKLLGQTAVVEAVFSGVEGHGRAYGRIKAEGEVFPADFELKEGEVIEVGDEVTIASVDQAKRSFVVELKK